MGILIKYILGHLTPCLQPFHGLPPPLTWISSLKPGSAGSGFLRTVWWDSGHYIPSLSQAIPLLNVLFFNYYYYFNIYLFIWMRRVLVAACGLLSCGMQTLSCGMRTLSCGMHVGSSSWTRDRTQAPCIGSRSLSHCATREIPTFKCLIR